MIILPAIDILDQQPVRLYQGDYEQKECVGDSIADIARAFEQQGAEYVHMVDLNGAKEGKKINQDSIVKTAQSLSIPVEPLALIVKMVWFVVMAGCRKARYSISTLRFRWRLSE